MGQDVTRTIDHLSKDVRNYSLKLKTYKVQLYSGKSFWYRIFMKPTNKKKNIGFCSNSYNHDTEDLDKWKASTLSSIQVFQFNNYTYSTIAETLIK